MNLCEVCSNKWAEWQCQDCRAEVCYRCNIHHRCADYDADEPDSAPPSEGVRVRFE